MRAMCSTMVLGSAPSIICSAVCAATRPSWRRGCRTVVSFGLTLWAMGWSSNPTTDTSRGTLTPRSRIASMAPDAMRSEPASRPSMASTRSSRWRMAKKPSLAPQPV